MSLELTWIYSARVQKCDQLKDPYQQCFGIWGLFYLGDSGVYPHQNFLTLHKILSYLPLMLTKNNACASITPDMTTLFSYLPVYHFY